MAYCGNTCLGPECAVDRCAIDTVVLVVHAVVGKQCVVLDSEVLEEGHAVEKPICTRKTALAWRGMSTAHYASIAVMMKLNRVCEAADAGGERLLCSWFVGRSRGKIWFVPSQSQHSVNCSAGLRTCLHPRCPSSRLCYRRSSTHSRPTDSHRAWRLPGHSHRLSEPTLRRRCAIPRRLSRADCVISIP